MGIFVLDIETYKTENQAIIDGIAENIACPGNIKKPESIKDWEKDKKPEAINQAVEKTVFDGGAGQIIAFSCCIDDGPIFNAWRTDEKSEADLLGEINQELALAFSKIHGKSETTVPLTWVGQNITGFDLRFLWKRFIVNEIKPAVRIPYNAKPWDKDIYDTMVEWGGVNDRKSMEFICQALGIEYDTSFTGKDVGEAWENKEFDKIGMYCGKDVERTREIYKRMTFK